MFFVCFTYFFFVYIMVGWLWVLLSGSICLSVGRGVGGVSGFVCEVVF